ncbi:MAG: sulfotransferase [Phycisphaera sp.]|nr:sulfotransferase [Phycisphaera sp.]
MSNPTPGSDPMPSTPNPLLDQAMAHARERRFVAATAALANAAVATPDDPRVDLACVQVSAARQDPIGVLTAAERLLEKIPTHAEARFHKAHALYSIGRLSDAITFIDSTDASNDPRLAHNLLGLRVKAMIRDADATEVMKDIERLQETEGRSPRLQLLRIQLQVRAGDQTAALAECDAMLRRSDLNPQDRCMAGLERARLLDRAERYSEAADAATLANEVRAPHFDHKAWADRASKNLRYFSADRLRSLPRPAVGLGDRAERPVFIVGMPRSGTSLLEQIIASHPDAGGVGERQEPFLIDEDMTQLMETPQWLEQAAGPLLDRAAGRYDTMIDRVGAPGRKVTNKALGLDSAIGMLATLLPEARFIWIHRTKEDNRLSIWMHHILQPWAWRLSDIDAAREAHDLARHHWAATLPDRTLVVGYEDLVGKQGEETARILDFLDLEPAEACLEFHRSSRPVMTPSALQVREPIHGRAIGRAHAYAGLLPGI